MLAWAEAGGEKQTVGIKRAFSETLAPDTESTFGLEQFQNCVKEIDGDARTLSTLPFRSSAVDRIRHHSWAIEIDDC